MLADPSAPPRPDSRRADCQFLRRSRRLVIACLLTIATAATPIPVSAQELRLGFSGRVTSLDPHFFVAVPNASVAMHIFDRLVHRAAGGALVPWLATGWRLLDDVTWEFTLRPGVRWHDGQPFTSDDVAFTIARVPNVPNSPGGFAANVRAIRRVEVIDPLTVRFHTDGPAPNLPADLSLVAVISRHAGAQATTDDYNEGRAAIGTGPYRLGHNQHGEVIDLVRNDDWWGPIPAWERVRVRIIVNNATRAAALLAGDLNVMEFPAPADIARLRTDPRIAVRSVEGGQAVYLTLDFSRTGPTPGATDLAGHPLPQNPLMDLRVRRALSLAINREALVDHAMEGMARPAGQLLAAGMFAYAPEVTIPRFDSVQARRLLAEAGYPDGFRLTLHTPSDRQPTDSIASQAVAQMWSRVGVPTQVDATPFSSFLTRAARQELSVRLTTSVSVIGEGGLLLVNFLQTYNPQKGQGMINNGRYSNLALDGLLDRAMATMDDDARARLLAEATGVVADDVAVIPLFLLHNVWAVRKGVLLDPRQDQRTLAFEMRRDE